MLSLFRSQFEAILLRAAPGLINLWVLLLLGDWLNASDYGFYSTGIATSGFLANLALGPLLFSIVSQYAGFEDRGLSDDYATSYISLAFIICGIVSVVGIFASNWGLLRWEWLALFVSFGLYTTIQELHRARLRLWFYGLFSITQSALNIFLAWLLVRPDASLGAALSSLAVSYAVAGLASLFATGRLRFRLPNLSLLADSLRIGSGYTVSTAIENSLFLGIRYIALIFGGSHSLGVFSFCLDISQRLVGFIINSASFAFVPKAFQLESSEGINSFWRTLRNGAAVATALSLLSFSIVILLKELDLVGSLSGDSFDILSFSIITIAVLLNRIKKLVVDPFAFLAKSPAKLSMGYAVGGAVALPVCAYLSYMGISYGIDVSYLLGYAIASIFTALTVRKTVLVKFQRT